MLCNDGGSEERLDSEATLSSLMSTIMLLFSRTTPLKMDCCNVSETSAVNMFSVISQRPRNLYSLKYSQVGGL